MIIIRWAAWWEALSEDAEIACSYCDVKGTKWEILPLHPMFTKGKARVAACLGCGQKVETRWWADARRKPGLCVDTSGVCIESALKTLREMI